MTSSASNPGHAEDDTFAHEVIGSFLAPYLDILHEELETESLREFYARLGVSETSLRELGVWISFSFLETFVNELVATLGSDEVIIRGGRLNITSKYGGPFIPLLKFLGTPSLVYRSLPSFTARLNKVSRVEVKEPQPGVAIISYFDKPGFKETSPHICTGRRAQLAAIPTIWGLPEARVTELDCRWSGDDACIYRVEFQRRVQIWGTLAGCLAGLVIALLSGSWLSPWSVMLLCVILGIVFGLLIDGRRIIRESRRFASEQSAALENLLEESESRYEKLLVESKRRKLAENEKGQLVSQLHLSERMASIGMLAAGVAHEINNPLAYILTNLDFLARELDSTSAQDIAARREELIRATLEAREGTSRIEKIVKQLNLHARSSEPERKLVNVNRSIESSLQLVHNEIRHRATLRKELTKTARVHVDPSQLEQVILNLLLNALHALDPRISARNVITVTSSMLDKSRVVIEIRDTGSGISEDVREHLFEPFFTTKDVGEGTGLGLYMCFNLVEEMGGTIDVESEVGKGSAFRIVLPASNWTPTTLPPPRFERVKPQSARILLVDDELPILRAYKRLFMEHDLRTARSVAEALEALEADHDVDVIFCDVMMPEQSGLELYRQIAERWPELMETFYFVTGGLLSEELRSQLENLTNRCLEKPLSKDELDAVIAASLDDGR